MGSNRKAVIMRRRDDSLDLFQRELCVVAARALIEHSAGGHDLDQIVALLVVHPYCFGSVLDAVDDSPGGAGIPRQIVAVAVGRVSMAARRSDGHAHRKNTRADYQTRIDRITQSD